MDFKIIRLTLGSFQSNCYIVYNENRECAIIDPGDEPDKIIEVISEYNLKPLYILLTHGHFDHVGAVNELRDKYKIDVYLNENDNILVDNERVNNFGIRVNKTNIDKDIRDNDKIDFGNKKFEVITTPGHTAGGVCFLLDNILFTGDTLFNGSIGRTDFSESNHEDMQQSLRKLIKLSKDLIILPGHGPESDLEQEINYNPFLRML